MAAHNDLDLSDLIIEKAKSLGASLIGITDVASLKDSPSHKVYEKIKPHQGAGPRGTAGVSCIGKIKWPAAAKSAVVIALAHEEDKPDLDWWDRNKGTEGNRILINVIKALSEWMEQEFNINTHHMPYHAESGGIFLKDAAVMAGLGCMGKNNLLVTPEFGPRVRFRVLLLDSQLPPAGPINFDPCEGCDEPCRQVCPQKAFSQIIYSPAKIKMVSLPGRNGCYSRSLCNIQMQKDIKAARVLETENESKLILCIRYCRRCELACPVGK